MRAYLFEADGERDAHYCDSLGNIRTERRGNTDDIRSDMGYITVCPSDGNNFNISTPRIDVERYGGSYPIHEAVGEFYAVATLVPNTYYFDLEYSNIVDVRVER